MSILKGRDLVVKFNDGLALGTTNNSIQVNTTYEEYYIKDKEGKQREFKEVSGSVSVEGLMVIGSSASSSTKDIGAAELMDIALVGSKVDIAFTLPSAKTPSGVPYSGEAWITDFSAGAPVDGQATYNASFSFDNLEKA